eukprot:CAMPEP_0198317222 /NCGR_PEP_ID=MMETSP1450-20131203/6776_1 /TAXON_ID=753684 ORGANISM="Madagascaria erythrocladiodes, Strain CCMP3234" /NCGR_SAMPLE_ID=MMETSP1450 /ASSEMBLY_ACC=CAM_ASM_001115 /LENGTH=222 /DNA_ID=CAMNT_0044020411 /DNA_START=124 /DNA_END=792 /DNA_ORIENTATION=-
MSKRQGSGIGAGDDFDEMVAEAFGSPKGKAAKSSEQEKFFRVDSSLSAVSMEDAQANRAPPPGHPDLFVLQDVGATGGGSREEGSVGLFEEFEWSPSGEKVKEETADSGRYSLESVTSAELLRLQNNTEALLMETNFEDGEAPDGAGGPKSGEERGGGALKHLDDMRRRIRRQAVERYKMKRAARSFSKRVRYESRRHMASKRPRVKGRFVKAAVSSIAGLF